MAIFYLWVTKTCKPNCLLKSKKGLNQALFEKNPVLFASHARERGLEIAVPTLKQIASFFYHENSAIDAEAVEERRPGASPVTS